MTQRYDRLADRLGIDTTFRKLRHYSATELIAGGVDPRTVAGRLGHGGGGTTTLKTYTAWVSEADQRAARGLGAGMPQRPAELEPAERARAEPRHPYEVVAAALSRSICGGHVAAGSFMPRAADLAVEHGVSLSTAKRALVLVRGWGLVTRVGRNRLQVVAPLFRSQCDVAELTPAEPDADVPLPGELLLDLAIRHRGEVVARLSAPADPRSADDLRSLLADAIRRRGDDESRIVEYEMDVREAGNNELVTTFVASQRRRAFGR